MSVRGAREGGGGSVRGGGGGGEESLWCRWLRASEEVEIAEEKAWAHARKEAAKDRAGSGSVSC
jgi:hypothetical protein